MSLNVLRVKCRHATVLQQDLLFTVLPPKNSLEQDRVPDWYVALPTEIKVNRYQVRISVRSNISCHLSWQSQGHPLDLRRRRSDPRWRERGGRRWPGSRCSGGSKSSTRSWSRPAMKFCRDRLGKSTYNIFFGWKSSDVAAAACSFKHFCGQGSSNTFIDTKKCCNELRYTVRTMLCSY